MAEVDMAKLYENLPDNSHANRDSRKNISEKTTAPVDEKRAEKVVHGKVKVKKNNARKLTDMFISEDVSNVKNYIIMDVIVPSIKKALYELVVGALDMTLYGGKSGGSKRPVADKVSYNTDYSRASTRYDHSYGVNRTATGYSYDDILLETRGEAEAVLQGMDDIMETYDMVRVADLYELVGITGEYTDNKYGWTNIRSAKIVRTRDGYKIEMPRAVILK